MAYHPMKKQDKSIIYLDFRCK